MAAGAGDFEGALGALLAANVAQVHRILRRFGEQDARVHLHGLERFGSVDQVHGLRQRFDRVNFDALDHGGFAALASGTTSARMPCSRTHSAAESAPRTGRTLPSSESSPRKT